MATNALYHVLFDTKPNKMGSLAIGSNLPGLRLTGSTESVDPKAMSPFGSGLTTKAVLYAGVTNAIYQIAKNQLTIVEAGEDTYVSEVPYRTASGDTRNTHYLVTALSANGEYQAAVCVPAPDGKGEPTCSPVPAVGSKDMRESVPYEGLYAPLLPFVCRKDENMKKDLDLVIAAFAQGHDLSEGTAYADERNALFRLNHAAYWGAMRNNTGIPCPSIPDTLTIAKISPKQIARRAFNGDVIYGNTEPVILNQDCKAPTTKNVKTYAGACDAFADIRVPIDEIPERFRQYIPKFAPDFPVPKEVLSMLNMTKSTNRLPEPFRNFMWRGETGFGKSTGAGLYAAIRGLPLLRLTCFPTMERQDFLASFVPNDSANSASNMPELPPWDYIMMDSESSYKMVTGEAKDGATPQDVLTAYTNLCAHKPTSSNLFKLVESDFITALQYGFVVEVQELSAIRDPGVMLSINEYDRPGAIIPLVDGRKVTRHERAVVIATDNPGYEGTNPINQAVLRRFHMVFDSWDMPESDAISRVTYNTNFSDAALLKKMYKLWSNIRDFCKKNEFTEGDTSIISLENWAKVEENCGDMMNLRESCIVCVVAKATARPEEQEAIITTVLDNDPLTTAKKQSKFTHKS